MTNYFWSCDWGSSSFRLRLVESASHKVIDEIKTSMGSTTLVQTSSAASDKNLLFEQYLNEQISQLSTNLPLGRYPCVLSGMITAAHGWVPLPYANIPFSLGGSHLHYQKKQASHDAIEALYFLSGIQTKNDVMRGEETETIGLFQIEELKQLGQNSTLILPGTHSKHVHIFDHQIVGFETYMTGELFGILSKHSVLRLSLPEKIEEQKTELSPEEHHAFELGAQQGSESSSSQALFSVRTNGLFNKYPPEENYYYFCGILIGCEIHEIRKQNRTEPLLLYANGEIRTFYETALKTVGLGNQVVDVVLDPHSIPAVLGHSAFLQHLFK